MGACLWYIVYTVSRPQARLCLLASDNLPAKRCTIQRRYDTGTSMIQLSYIILWLSDKILVITRALIRSWGARVVPPLHTLEDLSSMPHPILAKTRHGQQSRWASGSETLVQLLSEQHWHCCSPPGRSEQKPHNGPSEGGMLQRGWLVQESGDVRRLPTASSEHRLH